MDTLIKNIFPTGEKIDQVFIEILLEKLISPLLKCFEDKIEKIRGMSIDLVLKIIENYKISDKITNLIVNTIISRANTIPFSETCKYSFNL